MEACDNVKLCLCFKSKKGNVHQSNTSKHLCQCLLWTASRKPADTFWCRSRSLVSMACCPPFWLSTGEPMSHVRVAKASIQVKWFRDSPSNI